MANCRDSRRIRNTQITENAGKRLHIIASNKMYVMCTTALLMEESVFDSLVYFNHVTRLSDRESCVEQKNALYLCRSKTCLLKARDQVDTQTCYLVIGRLWGGARTGFIRHRKGENCGILSAGR